jgi:diguanylate cyclase (GGDEF)-like protein
VAQLRSRRGSAVVPYGACFLATWGLIGLESRLRVAEVVAALVLQVLVGVLLVFLPRWDGLRWIGLVGMAAFLVSVALLRDGVGETAGYGTLLLLPVVWAALRGRRSKLVWALIGAAVVLFVPLVFVGGVRYSESSWGTAGLLIVVAAVLGFTVLELMERLRVTTAEQRALRQIATLVASGAEPEVIFGAVGEQVADLLDATVAGVVRFKPEAGIGEIVGGWSADGNEIAGMTVELAGSTAAAAVYRAVETVHIAAYVNPKSDAILDRLSLAGAVGAPIFVDRKPWGSLTAAFRTGTAIPPDADQRLASFAELVTVAIANAEAWEALGRQAATDPLTGLANQRTFHHRLLSELERASRHGQVLSVAMLDIDHFKLINDSHGHQTGDQVIIEVGRLLAIEGARAGDLIARVGGEEFAWLMPETDQEGAKAAVERVRRLVDATSFRTAGAVTISAGICSNEHHESKTADELVGLADQALYWGKRTGRNTTNIYTDAARHAFANQSA